MTYQIAERWRPMRNGDAISPTQVAEGFRNSQENLIMKLSGGQNGTQNPTLAFVYSCPMKDKERLDVCVNHYFRTAPDGNLRFFTCLVDGYISNYFQPEPAALQSRQEKENMLKVAAIGLEDVFEFFGDIPTTSPTYSKDIEILRRVHEITKRLKNGEFTDEDFALIWDGVIRR